MKTKVIETELGQIKRALAAMGARLFGNESMDAKRNAQRNLEGRTHYVDDDTLRWHKSRVLEARTIENGLLFEIVTSDALDMNNTKRGFRGVVFDVFGTSVYRPDLEGAFATKRAAVKDCENAEFDLVAHYLAAIARRREDCDRALTQATAAMEVMS